jgi:uncharacterized protein YggU (UPF0235/DUF167 family)
MYVKVRVIADAKKEIVVKESTDHYRISVREKAEHNMANSRVREIVADEFRVPVQKIRIVSGHHSPSKILSVDVES